MDEPSGGGRNRTCDQELRRLLLCPLSYAPGRGTVPVNVPAPVGSTVRVESLCIAAGRRRFTLVAEQRLPLDPAELYTPV